MKLIGIFEFSFGKRLVFEGEVLLFETLNSGVSSLLGSFLILSHLNQVRLSVGNL